MLTTRQASLLRLIVDDYITTASPIASETLARNHSLSVSPATIRNEVALLEETGYLTRPHTSAGSVPLDKAYRFYVESLMDEETEKIPPRVQSSIRRRLSQVERDLDDWADIAASTLARLVGNMAIVTFPKAKVSRVRHLELVPLQDFLAMVIVVLEQARLRRRLIELNDTLDTAALEASVNKINHQLVGLTQREIESKTLDEPTQLEEKVREATILVLREEDRALYREHYIHGLRNLLDQPEFAENDRVRTLVQGVEDRSLVHAVLEEIPEGDVVRVIIGQENRGDLLWPLSVVICQYGIPDGAVGAIGPTRMEYPKTIAGVKFMSSAMSEMVEAMRS